MKKAEELHLDLEEGSLRQAAATRKHKVHVGAAIMPDYLNPHYDPYSEVLNRGMYICARIMGALLLFV